MEFPRNIRSHEKFGANAWDWGVFNDLFPRPGMAFSDVDGRAEVHGYFLELEAKPVGKPVNGGQAMAYSRRIADDRTLVIYVWGETDVPSLYQVLGVDDAPVPCDVEALRAVVGAWVEWAERQPWAPTLNRDHLFGRGEIEAIRNGTTAACDSPRIPGTFLACGGRNPAKEGREAPSYVPANNPRGMNA